MIHDSSSIPYRSALAACRVFESTDVDETREKVSQVMQPHELLPVGRVDNMKAHMDFLRLPGMGIGAIKFGHMRVNVDAIEGYHLVLFCLSGSGRIFAENSNAVDVDARHGYYVPPGAPFRAEFSEDCEQFVMRINDDTWRVQAGGASSRLNVAIDLSKPQMHPWLATINDILTVPGTVELIQGHDAVARSYEQLLLNLLFAGQGVQDAHRAVPAPGIVKRAERFLRENAAEPLRLEDVAMAAGVPPRTLLASFQRFRNTSPMRFLRDLRLDQARIKLLSDAEGISVTNAALDCGFTHFGRFSRYYAQRFGESPSETLACKRWRRLH